MRNDEAYLRNIIDLVGEIDWLLPGIDLSTFLAVDTIRSTTLLKLVFIGEATRHLSNELKSRYPDVPWADIVGFRNVAVHQYLDIDWERVWTTATSDAPAYREQVRAILAAEFPQESNDK